MTNRLCELKTNNEQLQKQINKLEAENLKYKKIIFCGQLKNWVFETLYNKGEITVISLTGGRTQIPVAHYTTVLDIKKAIYEKIGIPEHQCRLIFGSKQIMNHRTLFHYLIPAGGTIHMVMNINTRSTLELCLNEAQLLERNTDLWYQDRFTTNLIRKREYEQIYGLINSSYTVREPGPIIRVPSPPPPDPAAAAEPVTSPPRAAEPVPCTASRSTRCARHTADDAMRAEHEEEEDLYL